MHCTEPLSPRKGRLRSFRDDDDDDDDIGECLIVLSIRKHISFFPVN